MAAAASAAVNPGGSPPVVLLTVPLLLEPPEPEVSVGPVFPVVPGPVLALPIALLDVAAEPPVLALFGPLLVDVAPEATVETLPVDAAVVELEPVVALVRLAVVSDCPLLVRSVD